MEKEIAKIERKGSSNNIALEVIVKPSTEVKLYEYFYLQKKINPDNLEEGGEENINLNIIELQLKCQKLITQISRSAPFMPR